MAEHRLVAGIEVDHAGRRWRVHRLLGPDAVLLRGEAGEIVSADPVRVAVPDAAPAATAIDERDYTPAEWDEAGRRRDVPTALAGLPARTASDVAAACRELGLNRRILALLRQTIDGDGDIAALLPKRTRRRAQRLGPDIEAIVDRAIRDGYARPTRPALSELHRTVAAHGATAGLATPSYKALQARVRRRNQAWLKRRREGPEAARPHGC